MRRPYRVGLPLARPPGMPTPCAGCSKVPAEHRLLALHAPGVARLEALEPTDRSRLAYRRYREWRAVGQFPDDPIVRWAAGLIREAEEEAERLPQRQLVTLLGGKILV